MAKARNLAETVTLTVSTTPRVKAYLEAMAETELFGKNPAEVADRLLNERIIHLMDSARPFERDIVERAEQRWREKIEDKG